MKKIIALFLVVILAFSLVACSMGKDKNNTSSNPPANSGNNSNDANGTNNNNANGNNNSGNSGNNSNNSNNNTRNTESMLESMIPDISTNVSTEGQR